MLGEASTPEIAKRKAVQGFKENRNVAKEGGAVAGNARRELEAKSGVPVVSTANYLPQSDSFLIQEGGAVKGEDEEQVE